MDLLDSRVLPVQKHVTSCTHRKAFSARLCEELSSQLNQNHFEMKSFFESEAQNRQIIITLSSLYQKKHKINILHKQ